MNFPCSFSIAYFFQGGRGKCLKVSKNKIKESHFKSQRLFSLKDLVVAGDTSSLSVSDKGQGY
jgi:hypothetical protein